MQDSRPDPAQNRSIKIIVLDLASPFAVGGILFALRSRLIHPWCAVTPTPCRIETVNALDQLSFAMGSVRLDYWSNVVQNSLAGILYALPLVLAWVYRRRWVPALWDTLTFGVVTLWNFAWIEIVRSIAQRPRPLVFRDPLGDGLNVHQYTSFYSGHTSFTALATLTIYYYFCRTAPTHRGLQRAALALAILLPIGMGILRVMAGRHYPTDVIFGGFFGWLIAYGFERYRRMRDARQNPVVLASTPL